MEERRLGERELAEALEDIRQIRDVMEKIRVSHPVRAVIRPALLLGLWSAPWFLAYGILAQWALRLQGEYAGLGSTGWLWVIHIGAFAPFSFIKTWLYKRKLAQSSDYDGLMSFMRRIVLESGYIRILGALMTFFGVSTWLLIQGHQAHHIVSLVCLAIGGVFLLAPLALPFPEFTMPALFFLLCGLLSLFFFPAYPFSKLGVFFCFGFGLMGIFGMRMPKDHRASPQEEEVREDG